MNQEEILAQISKLPLAEKLAIHQNIWTEITKENKTLPMDEWQKKELDKRYKLYQQDKMKCHNWQDVHKSLRQTS